MDKDQITSNLGELIKNQIEICEKLDKIAKRIKKIGKPKKEPNYELKGGVFAKGADSKSPFVCAGESIISKKQSDQLTPKQDQKYYLCIKPFGLFKEGLILKYKHYCSLLNDHFYNCINGVYGIYLRDIKREPEYFIPIQQFETLKEGQEIEFTLRNGKTYKTLVKKDSCDKYTLSLWHQLGNCPYQELNQIEFKTNLLKEYGNSWWLTTNNLEDLTKELNKLITLPDLSKESKHIKTDQNESLLVQANELIDKFMPLVNGWDKNQPKHNECYQGAINEPVIGLWYYSQQNQRKAAIKCAIVHCELITGNITSDKYFSKTIDIKEQLQKMLSE